MKFSFISRTTSCPLILHPVSTSMDNLNFLVATGPLAISDFRCTLLGYYAASGINFLLTFHEKLSVPSSRVKMIGCPKTLVRNYHYSLRNNPKERSSQLTHCCTALTGLCTCFPTRPSPSVLWTTHLRKWQCTVQLSEFQVVSMSWPPVWVGWIWMEPKVANIDRFHCNMKFQVHHNCHQETGARSGAVGWGTALQAGRSRVRFPMVSLEFFIDIILPVTLWPWGRISH